MLELEFFAPKIPRGFSTLIFLLSLAACGGPDRPLDADTKQQIDSIASVEMRKVRGQMDTLCNQQRLTVLPRMIDSIKLVREDEIREALKNVPQ